MGLVSAAVLAAAAMVGVTVPASAAAGSTPDHGLRADWFTASGSDGWALHEQNLTFTTVQDDLDLGDMLASYRALAGRTDDVGARFTGFVTAPATGDYTFSVIGDNGFRLWVGDEQAPDIDFWVDRWDTEQTAAPVHLEAGQPVPFRFEIFQHNGGANAHVRWASADAGVAKQAVPASAFTPPDGFTLPDVTGALGASGDDLTLTFGGAATGTAAGLAGHLRVLVDGTAYPLAAVAASGATLAVTLGAQALQGSQLFVVYDGAGDLAVDGQAVDAFAVGASNASTYVLTTPWADKVGATPLPEYPRPQLERRDWQNLDGTWDLVALDAADSALPSAWSDAEDVLVPFPIESRLSGIGRHEDHVAYHRTFTVPAAWHIGEGTGKQRLMLNFGAVDFDATVIVNGTVVTRHLGGYDAFSADITSALKPGANDLVVRVSDTTGLTPKGKQSSSPGGIFYTASSGIWQTVWLEPVARAHATALDITPVLGDVAGDRGAAGAGADALQVVAHTAGASADTRVTVTVLDKGGEEVAHANGRPEAPLTLTIDRAHRWSPDDPYLYDLDVKVSDKGSLDAISSYAGVRSIGVKQIGGANRIVLSGERTFLLSTLDQGFWPDGIYTAPTDEALAWDIQQTKDLGFNTIRKHIKVEPARWYYHADQIGMLVWQDMPSAFTSRNAQATAPAVTDEWEDELQAMVEQHRSVTSIIGWIPFNEGWSEWDLAATRRVAQEVKALDPSRLVNTHSGQNCCQSLGDAGAGDIIDWHQYTGPASPTPDATRAAIDGEHGGFSLSVLGHVWPGGSVNPYGEVATSQALTDAYVGNTAHLVGLARQKLSGSIYTQLTDVEGEVNGFWTYDRRVLKMDAAAVRRANEAVIAAGSGQPVPPGTPGLGGIASWAFDTADGGVSPDGVGASGATLRGGATLGAGHDGQALLTDGVDDHATASVPSLDTTGSYSVAAWVRLDAKPGSGGYATALGADGMDGQSAFFLQYSGVANGWAFSYPGGPRAIAPTPTNAGEWHHVTGVRDAQAGTIALYLDGVRVAQGTTFDTPATTGTVTVGRAQWEHNPVDFLHGAVDDVRLFDRALTNQEVAQLAG
ncbi:LamG-like jellyroll fold domain-containing protein [Xylanimonas sp. McL0601]|uniref:LamG-like jellyroll fold domain-containing protein n=1 Tax=Xylanimonas sp. McL0601 TaxID=3414739 RepID=UPI003CEF6283